MFENSDGSEASNRTERIGKGKRKRSIRNICIPVVSRAEVEVCIWLTVYISSDPSADSADVEIDRSPEERRRERWREW